MPDTDMTASRGTAALLFSCEEQVGTVAAVAHFFAQRGINISRLQEFTDTGFLFSRWEWELNQEWEDANEFDDEFAQAIAHFDASFNSRFFDTKHSLGLMVEDASHTLVEIVSRQENDYFPHSEITFILGSDEGAREVADRHGIPFFYIPLEGGGSAYEQKQLEIVQRYKPDYLGLASYRKGVSNKFLQEVGCLVVSASNTFLPSFAGPGAYQAAYHRGVKLVAASAQIVTSDLDKGPIVEQDVLRVPTAATVDEIVKLGQLVERKVFAHALEKMLQHKVLVHHNRTLIFS